MAKDLYGHKQMYQSPVGVLLKSGAILIVLFILIDIGFDIYYQIKVKNDTKEAIKVMMRKENLETDEDYYTYFWESLSDKESYNKEKVNTTIQEDGSIVIKNQIDYYGFLENFSKIIPIFKVHKTTKLAAYKVYLNEYKEVVIEKYDLKKEADELEQKELEENELN